MDASAARRPGEKTHSGHVHVGTECWPAACYIPSMDKMGKAAEPPWLETGGLLEAIERHGADGGTLLVRLHRCGGWELKQAAERAAVKVSQADMDMARRALAIGSDLRREWQLALLFAEYRELAAEAVGRAFNGIT